MSSIRTPAFYCKISLDNPSLTCTRQNTPAPTTLSRPVVIVPDARNQLFCNRIEYQHRFTAADMHDDSLDSEEGEQHGRRSLDRVHKMLQHNLHSKLLMIADSQDRMLIN